MAKWAFHDFDWHPKRKVRGWWVLIPNRIAIFIIGPLGIRFHGPEMRDDLGVPVRD